MYSNDMNLSLSGDTFSILKGQYDSVLNRTLGNMEMKGAEEATITVKVGIKLERTSVGNRTIVRPTFKHDISSVMQVKDKVSGELVGDYQLVWDDDEQRYVMRKIDNGQTSLFNDDEPNGIFVDADYQPVDVDSHTVDALPESLRGLPEHTEIDGKQGESDDTAESENSELNDAEGSEKASEDVHEAGDVAEMSAKSDRYDEKTPFGWLAQFVGEEMRVTEAMGNYTVRTDTNKVVLSSATDPSNPFYCDRDNLAEHVGHKLICAGYGKEDLTVISIQCSGCAAALFTLVAPDATEEEVSEAMKDDGDGEGNEPADDGSYDYDLPDE